MTAPDSNTWLIILLQAIGWVFLWFKREGVKDFQHKKLWTDYERRHGLNGYAKGSENEGG